MYKRTKIVNKAGEENSLEEKVLQIKRVSKKTKGGNSFGFSALVVVGDKKGTVGIGLGKAKDVRSAIQKGIKNAKKEVFNVPIAGTTIPHGVVVKKGAARLIIKPALPGSGLLVGGVLRSVVELSGIRDISIKNVGTRNKLSTVNAAVAAFKGMRLIQRESVK